MAVYFGKINVDDIVFGPTERGTNGNKYKRMSYNNAQLKDIQLGEDINDLLTCPYGVEPVSAQVKDKFCIKLVANEKLAKFVMSIDEKVIEEVDSADLVHRSVFRSAMIDTVKIKLAPDVDILVTQLKGTNKITPPVAGTLTDVTSNCTLLPIVKFQGGVYFIEDSYGTSIVASKILVVKNAKSAASAFDLGAGVSMEVDED